MTTRQKMKPCPNCKTAVHLAVYSYEEHGNVKHVECDKCYYLGPGKGSINAAVKSHNESVTGGEHAN